MIAQRDVPFTSVGRISQILLALAVCVAPACSETPVEPAPSDPAPFELTLDGSIGLEMTLDSVRGPGPGRLLPLDPPRRQVGSIAFADMSLVPGGPRRLHARIQLDFMELLGREMSCFEEGWRRVHVGHEGSDWYVNFMPDASDCGFSAVMSRAPDGSLVGRWYEGWMIGAVAAGEIRFSAP